jgi:hypothetical protein
LLTPSPPSSKFKIPSAEQNPFPLTIWEILFLVFAVLAIVACGVVTTVIIMGHMTTKNTHVVPTIQHASNSTATAIPSVYMNLTSNERFNHIRDWLSDYDHPFDPTPGSPQYHAILWMAFVDMPTILGKGIQKPLNSTNMNLSIRITQRYVLLVIFFQNIGMDHLALGGWASITGARLTECIWPGVTCTTIKVNNEDGTTANSITQEVTVVTGLNLNPTIGLLRGSLPTELGLLSNLRTLQNVHCSVRTRSTILMFFFSDFLGYRKFGACEQFSDGGDTIQCFLFVQSLYVTENLIFRLNCSQTH